MRKRKLAKRAGRPAYRTWEQHEAEIADRFRHRRNSTSIHTADWHPCDEEDEAARNLPASLRAYLLGNMDIAFPPSEALHNNRQHGNMLSTLVLMNIAFLTERYGGQHPSIPRLTCLAKRYRKEGK